MWGKGRAKGSVSSAGTFTIAVCTFRDQMAATKTLFFCQNCGAQSVRWLGRCPSCGEWNTYAEEVVKKTKSQRSTSAATAERLDELSPAGMVVLPTPDNEFNRVLGGGLVQGSVVLLGGEPGFGKSTLLLQLALRLQNQRVLYVSGEESLQQIKLRADRLGPMQSDCWLLAETNVEEVLAQARQLQPHLLIIDSIQTLQSPSLESPAGSVGQVRDTAAALVRYAKETGTPVLLIGHITKDGVLAGPKVLEHMVDVVLQLEGDRHYAFRILRSFKNRFGSAMELGIYELTDAGMVAVQNPSQVLLTERHQPVSGIATAVILEGARPLLIETQALVTPYVYGT
ncbi:MAG: DNA repair protein RadA, partial [Chitinophagales bacterium]|nr:DNA repair protein RadA [Chitinophagales bacterium]MDW8427235.1 AAA family ATPase [Chitinophagales bacterium]